MDDKYTWKAVYNDGTFLLQINSDGSKNAYSDIDRTKLKAFELYEGGQRKLWVPFLSGERLIWRRRVAMNQGENTQQVVHLVGKQITSKGENHQILVALYEDGQVEVTAGWNNNHPWFYEVQPLPEEKN